MSLNITTIVDSTVTSWKVGAKSLFSTRAWSTTARRLDFCLWCCYLLQRLWKAFTCFCCLVTQKTRMEFVNMGLLRCRLTFLKGTECVTPMLMVGKTLGSPEECHKLCWNERHLLVFALSLVPNVPRSSISYNSPWLDFLQRYKLNPKFPYNEQYVGLAALENKILTGKRRG